LAVDALDAVVGAGAGAEADGSCAGVDGDVAGDQDVVAGLRAGPGRVEVSPQPSTGLSSGAYASRYASSSHGWRFAQACSAVA
jgi:hypothetical protein